MRADEKDGRAKGVREDRAQPEAKELEAALGVEAAGSGRAGEGEGRHAEGLLEALDAGRVLVVRCLL